MEQTKVDQIESILSDNGYSYDDVMENRWEYPYTLNDIAGLYWLEFFIEKDTDDEDPFWKWLIKLSLGWNIHYLSKRYSFSRSLSITQLDASLTDIKNEIDSIQEHIDQLSIYDLNNYEW